MDQVTTGAWVALAQLLGPALGVAFGIGLIVALIQAVTSVQESSLSFAPKVAALLLLFALAGSAMFSGVVEYAAQLFHSLPQLIAYG